MQGNKFCRGSGISAQEANKKQEGNSIILSKGMLMSSLYIACMRSLIVLYRYTLISSSTCSFFRVLCLH
jgi:hypothetical protein